MPPPSFVRLRRRERGIRSIILLHSGGCGGIFVPSSSIYMGAGGNSCASGSINRFPVLRRTSRPPLPILRTPPLEFRNEIFKLEAGYEGKLGQWSGGGGGDGWWGLEIRRFTYGVDVYRRAVVAAAAAAVENAMTICGESRGWSWRVQYKRKEM